MALEPNDRPLQTRPTIWLLSHARELRSGIPAAMLCATFAQMVCFFSFFWPRAENDLMEKEQKEKGSKQNRFTTRELAALTADAAKLQRDKKNHLCLSEGGRANTCT